MDFCDFLVEKFRDGDFPIEQEFKVVSIAMWFVVCR